MLRVDLSETWTLQLAKGTKKNILIIVSNISLSEKKIKRKKKERKKTGEFNCFSHPFKLTFDEPTHMWSPHVNRVLCDA